MILFLFNNNDVKYYPLSFYINEFLTNHHPSKQLKFLTLFLIQGSWPIKIKGRDHNVEHCKAKPRDLGKVSKNTQNFFTYKDFLFSRNKSLLDCLISVVRTKKVALIRDTFSRPLKALDGKISIRL
jgi:hypothetical protein